MNGLGLTIRNALYTSNGSANVLRSKRWLNTIWNISPARMCSLACKTAFLYSSLFMVEFSTLGPKLRVSNFTEPAGSLGLKKTISNLHCNVNLKRLYWEVCNVNTQGLIPQKEIIYIYKIKLLRKKINKNYSRDNVMYPRY